MVCAGKADTPLLVTTDRYILFKIPWTEMQSRFVRQIIQLFSVVFYVLRAVYKLDFRLVTN